MANILPSKPTLPSAYDSYPIKCLTYSKMQQLRDQGLCLNCNNIDTPDHCCSIKRILLVMPDEDSTVEQQCMEAVKPVVPTTDLYFQTASSVNPSFPTLSFHQTTPTPSLTLLQTQPAQHAIQNCLRKQILPQEMQQRSNDSTTELLPPALAGFAISLDSYVQAIKYEVAEHKLFDLMLEKNFGALHFKVLDVRPTLNLTLSNGQEWADAHYMLVEMKQLLYESKVLVFDPGGTFRVARVSDLEDKVDLEGVGIDTHINQEAPRRIIHMPRRTIHMPRGFLDKEMQNGEMQI